MNSPEDALNAALEHELRSLQPLPPDPDFMNRLTRRMEEPFADRAPTQKIITFPQDKAPSARSTRNSWIAVAACATLATIAITWNQARLAKEADVIAETPHTPKFIPQSVNSQFHRVQEGGLIVDPEKGVMRKVRFEFNNSQQFIDPVNGSKLEIRYPSTEEILLQEPMQ
jgi:hypothetical protein